MLPLARARERAAPLPRGSAAPPEHHRRRAARRAHAGGDPRPHRARGRGRAVPAFDDRKLPDIEALTARRAVTLAGTRRQLLDGKSTACCRPTLAPEAHRLARARPPPLGPSPTARLRATRHWRVGSAFKVLGGALAAGPVGHQAAQRLLPARGELLQHRAVRRQRREFAPDLSLYGDVPLHAQSHGESFLALAANRFAGEGLYILDEPEAALSVTGRARAALDRPRGGGAPARSSSSPRTRRSCWPCPARTSTSWAPAASPSAPTTTSTPSGSRAASSTRPSATCARPWSSGCGAARLPRGHRLLRRPRRRAARLGAGRHRRRGGRVRAPWRAADPGRSADGGRPRARLRDLARAARPRRGAAVVRRAVRARLPGGRGA